MHDDCKVLIRNKLMKQMNVALIEPAEQGRQCRDDAK